MISSIDAAGDSIVGRRGRFSLVDVLVFFGLVAVILCLLLPVLQRGRLAADRTACQNRLREIGTVFQKTQPNFGDRLRPENLQASFATYLPDRRIWQCPQGPVSKPSYGFNSRLHRLHDLDSQRVLGLDYKQLVVDVVGPNSRRDQWQDLIATRHQGRCNVLFYAGNVESLDPAAIDPRVCWLHERYWRPAIDSALKRTGEADCEPPVVASR